MLYGPDDKPIINEAGVGVALRMVRGADELFATIMEAERRIYTKILAPNGNYARYEVEQQEISELERML